MEYKLLAQEILRLVGGESNVVKVTHCVSRLRFYLHDETKADTHAIKALEGVLDAKFLVGQYQVVIGPRVELVYRELIEASNLEDAYIRPTLKTQNPIKALFKGFRGTSR